MQELWVDKYAPKSFDEYVFRDQNLKSDAEGWIKSKATPHLLFSGRPGVGKSSLVKLLLKLMDVKRGDILWVNASHENNVDAIRDKVVGFASTMPFGDGFKYVVLDEGERLSIQAQDILKGVIEQYQGNCRFIITTNNAHKIIPALSDSRFVGGRYHIEKSDENEFLMRLVTILQSEGVEIATEADINNIQTFMTASYPDMRKAISLLQKHVKNGVLIAPSDGDSSAIDEYKVKVIDLFKHGKIYEGRKLLVENAKSDEYEDFFRLFYKNLDWWGSSIEQQDEAILVIRDGLYKNSLVADQEINVSATLVQLCKIKNGK